MLVLDWISGNTTTPGKLLCGVLLSTYSSVYLFTLPLVICSLGRVWELLRTSLFKSLGEWRLSSIPHCSLLKNEIQPSFPPPSLSGIVAISTWVGKSVGILKMFLFTLCVCAWVWRLQVNLRWGSPGAIDLLVLRRVPLTGLELTKQAMLSTSKLQESLFQPL